MKKENKISTVYLAIIAGAVIISFLILAKSLLIPLCWSLLFAILILPFTKWLEKKLKYKSIAITIAVMLLFLILAGVLFGLSSQVYSIANDIPKLSGKFTENIDGLRRLIATYLNVPYSNQSSELINGITSTIQELVGSLAAAFKGTIKAIFMIAMIPFFMFFILYYRSRVFHFISKKYTSKETNKITATIVKMLEVVQKYLLGMMIDTLIVAILAFIVFYSLGIKHVLFFSVFVAVMNLIPFVGVFIASAISIFYVFVVKDSLMYPILILILLWVIQLIENNLIKPYVVGSQVKLNSFAVIISVIVGGMIWGASGMMLFIPLLAVIKIVFDEVEFLKPYGYLLGDE